jgi:hypothetical protein
MWFKVVRQTASGVYSDAEPDPDLRRVFNERVRAVAWERCLILYRFPYLNYTLGFIPQPMWQAC